MRCVIGQLIFGSIVAVLVVTQSPIAITSAIVAIALLGTVISQLIFGYLGDRMGRRRVYGLALMCMVLSSIGCGFSICTFAICILVSLGFFKIDDGSSDTLNPGFLMKPCDAKLWEASTQ